MGFWDSPYPGQPIDPGLPPGYDPAQHDPLMAALLAQNAQPQPSMLGYDPASLIDTPGALPLTSQDQASRFMDQGARAVTPTLDSLGNALSLPGRALYGPESAGWERYGEAKPEEALNAAGWVTMPSLGRAAMAGGVPRDLMSVGGAADKAGMLASEPPSITAYHGSPHDFDKFDISKIGTGEGAQAYGHGLYFAGNEGVAQVYRDNLAKPDFNFTKSGSPISSEVSRMLSDGYDAAASQGIRGPSVNDAVFMAQKNLEGQRAAALKASDFDWFNKVSDQQSELQRVAQEPPKMGGKMYQVQIHADPEHFLDWDKPLSEQHPKVQEALKSITDQLEVKPSTIETNKNDLYHNGQWMGYAPTGDIADMRVPQIEQIARTAIGPTALRDAGIPGIKYLDAGSRGGMPNQTLADANAAHRAVSQQIGALQDQMVNEHVVKYGAPDNGWGSIGVEPSPEIQAKYQPQMDSLNAKLKAAADNVEQAKSIKPKETHNYVTFSDDIIQILKKYGIAGLGLAGYGAAQSQGQTQAQ